MPEEEESSQSALVGGGTRAAIALALGGTGRVAGKLAPARGRPHLNWGEALYYAGPRDDAEAQFARAAALDMMPSEKTELRNYFAHSI